MKKRYLFAGCFVAAVISLSGQSTYEEVYDKLWYEQPAQEWVQALPIGNGGMGAMIYGTPQRECLQLNEDTLWAGGPGNNLPEGFAGILPKVREQIFAGQYKEAENTLMEVIPFQPKATSNYGMAYQTAGNLLIEFPGHEDYRHYYRELDVRHATGGVRYEVDGVEYQREYFTTAVDQVIAVRLTASREGAISCRLRLETPQPNHTLYVESDQLVLKGVTGDMENKKGAVRFEIRALPILQGGQLVMQEDYLEIVGADEAIVYLSIGTGFNNFKDVSGDAHQRALEPLRRIKERTYDDIREDHIADYRQYFNRVSIDLGTTDAMLKPTDQRIREFYDGDDPQLVSLYYQFGRYLLISSSRPGTQPANLQGIWNESLYPAWDCKYTVNINTEMNYWPAEPTNLAEMHEPLFSMLQDLTQTGADAAREMYGARGWAMHHNTDIWRITGPIDGAYFGVWPMGGAWLTQHLWQHYLYSGDSDFLKQAYPIMKGSALFFADVLQREPNHGWLVVNPGMSPENAHPGGTTLAAGNTMDNQLVFDVFSNVIRAAQILDLDADLVEELQGKLAQLPPMQIGRHEQLQEWINDWDRVDDHHRHVSHLYGLFPSDQISPFSNPKLFQAARNVLEYRGDQSTGWSMGWKVNLWARLLDGNRAFKLIREQLVPCTVTSYDGGGGTYPNLFDAHPPFQIDGNFGCTSGITEMLVQSYDGFIYLLPALPDAWKDGSIRGIRTRGGFTVDLVWTDGQICEVTIRSALGGNCRIRSAVPLTGDGVLSEVRDDVDNPNPFFRKNVIAEPMMADGVKMERLKLPESYLYDFETAPNTVYHFQAPSLALEDTH